MPDQRSVMTEYRYLDEKRLAQGLTPQEEARYARLRDLVGPELAAAPGRQGFDVNAAAAKLRDSLIPAGLRNRPPPTPAPEPVPELEPEPMYAEQGAGDALASGYAEQPLDAEASPQPDQLFEPSSLGQEPPPYDPDAAYAADPNGAYAADPTQPWDPNAQPDAQAYDPDAYPADPNAAYPADPNAGYPAEAAAYDPNAPQAWDPNQPWDPSAAPEAQAYDPNAYAADPNAVYATDPNAGYPAEAAAYDPNAPQAWDPNQPWDPNALPEAQAQDPSAAYPADPNAAYPVDAAGYDPNAPAWDPNQPWDPNALPEAQAYDPDAAPVPDRAPAEPDLLSAEPLDPEVAPAGTPVAAAQNPGELPPEGWFAEPPPPEPVAEVGFGEYDAPQAELAGDDGAALAAEGLLPGEVLGAELAAPPPELGEYDDTAGFAAQPFEAPGEPEGAGALEAARPPPELDAGWRAEDALDQGFALESGGSFAAGADAAAPEWTQETAPPPWEGAAPLDVAALPELDSPGAGGYEVSPAPAGEGFAPLPHADLFSAPDGELAPHPDDALDPGLPQGDASGPAPDLDFSQPDFSAGDPAAAEPSAEAPSADTELAFADLPPEASGAADLPPLDLGFADPGAEPPPELAELTEVTELTDVTDAMEPLAEPAQVAAPALTLDVPAQAAATAAGEPSIAEEEIPTIDGADILEELVEDAPAEPPQPLDFEPLVPAPPRPAPPEPPAAPAPVAPPPPASAPPPEPARSGASRVEGSHRVVVHTIEGLVKRGLVEDAELEGPSLHVTAQPGLAPEEIATEKVKAIFFMLAPGEKAPAAEGKRVRVTFRDGRQVAGFSPDYDETGIGFFMIPADTRTNTGRIWVYRLAVRQVAVS